MKSEHGDPARLLVGVGVGPGDPELVTVKAVRALRRADVVLVPVLDETSAGRAEATVRAHLDPAADNDPVRRVVFTMGDRRGVTPRRRAAWEAAASAVVEAFDTGAQVVAFATIGDPNVYSTFSYLAQTVREQRHDVLVETIPGITAMQDLAARAGISLCEGTESLTLFPLTAGLDAFGELLQQADTVVAYKTGRQLPAALAALAAADRLTDAVVGTALGLPEERILPASDPEATTVAPYLTTVIAPATRSTRGGRL